MASVNDSPPPYTAIDTTGHHHHIISAEPDASPESPSAYVAFSASFPDIPVGGKKTAPVVSIDRLRAHLTVLAAFHALRRSVREARADDPDATWAIFLARAVHRFQKWALCARFMGNDIAPMPPLDVLMVWHSYLLVGYNSIRASYHSLH